MWTVYCHENRVNGKRYVGITSREITERWRDGKGYQNCFGRAVEKYGWDSFEHYVLFEDVTESFAKHKEKELIKCFNCLVPNGYNLTEGGDGNCGWKPSQSTRDKISRATTGHHGHVTSEETKRKISESHKGIQTCLGKHWTEERKQHISRLMCGNRYGANRVVSEASKDKARMNMPHRKAVQQFDLDGNFIAEYPSLKVAGYAVNTTSSNIGYCCRGLVKTCKGYKWKFVI